jgi:hypothetical protein
MLLPVRSIFLFTLALLCAGAVVGCKDEPAPALSPSQIERMSPPETLRFVDADSRIPNMTFFGHEAVGKSIAFVLDFSGSMEGEGKRALLQELELSFSHLPRTSSVSVILFTQTAEVISPQGATPVQGGNSAWFEASAASKRAFLRDLKLRPARGGTAWEPALQTALSLTPKPETIYFMTDGAGAEEKLDDVVSRITALNHSGATPAVIFSVGLGGAAFPKALADLALRNGLTP